ncbi:MAG: Glutamate 5-kinase [Clostridia bacterium 41_269]|nr:MAG: Glutamate 5-kinase [Clostridia bacterium 41_269]
MVIIGENEEGHRKILKGIKRVVVKIGTSSITQENGLLDMKKMEKIVNDIIAVMDRDVEVILVSSGAVGAGTGRLGLKDRPKTVPEKQAAAAVGQGVLVHSYEKLFDKYGKIVAQILLTREDIADRNRFLNARNTFITLLGYGVIPIVNENDTVAIEEIQFGDNDRLSALVACLVDADLLIILSDIDGVYTCDPKLSNEAKLISVIENLNSFEKATNFLGMPGSKFSTGGMITKFQAAKIAAQSGIPVVIANAMSENVLLDILERKSVGTLILPIGRLHAKKRWIGFGSNICGKIYVDKGAEKAIVENGKSLLPSGIIRTDGSFVVGDVVSVVNTDGKEIARGIVNYNAAEVEMIKGRHSDEIEEILGYRVCPEVIHRDNLTVMV